MTVEAERISVGLTDQDIGDCMSEQQKMIIMINEELKRKEDNND